MVVGWIRRNTIPGRSVTAVHSAASRGTGNFAGSGRNDPVPAISPSQPVRNGDQDLPSVDIGAAHRVAHCDKRSNAGRDRGICRHDYLGKSAYGKQKDLVVCRRVRFGFHS